MRQGNSKENMPTAVELNKNKKISFFLSKKILPRTSEKKKNINLKRYVVRIRAMDYSKRRNEKNGVIQNVAL